MDDGKRTCVQSLHERGLTILSQKNVRDVLFSARPSVSSQNKDDVTFLRSLGVDVVYTILEHPDFPEIEMEIDHTEQVHTHEHDGVTYKTMDFHPDIPVHADPKPNAAATNGALANTDYVIGMTSQLILERFRSSKEAFEGRQKVKKEPELKKTNRDFIS